MARGRKQRSSTTRATTGSPPAPAVSYANRAGDTYYLHEGQTKTGRVRYYVAKTVREGVLFAMPDSWEFTESINGVVSVRKIDTSAPSIPDIDLAIARAELARHDHLRLHRVEVVKGEIVVFEPDRSIDSIVQLSRTLGRSPEWMEARLESTPPRFAPIMKFVPDLAGEYAVRRMTYRGDGGWSWELAVGPLKTLVKRYLGKVGTEDFFELM
jgi:hypothetical protein